MEFGPYDLFLHMKPGIAQDKHIVLLDVDDQSIERSGSWPWPRGNMARGLEVLTEFDARMAVFDIEYIDHSPNSVDKQYLDLTLRSKFDDGFHDIQASTNALFSAVANRSIPLSSLKSYANDLSTMIGDTGNDLYAKTKQVAVENDSYLGKAMRMYGRAFVAFDIGENESSISNPKLAAEGIKRFQYANFKNKSSTLDSSRILTFPILEVTDMAENAGFADVKVDHDGRRRRIELVRMVHGTAFLQLVFSPFINLAGKPQLIYSPGSLQVKGAHMPFTPEGSTKDFTIPLDSEGYMLINWPKNIFNDSFKPHRPFIELLEYKDTENELARVLASLNLNEAWGLLPGANPVSVVLQAWNDSEAVRQAALESGKLEDRQAFVDAKDRFYQVLAELSATTLDKEAMEKLMEAKAGDSKVNAPLYDALAKKFQDSFVDIRKYESKLSEKRAEFKTILKDASCFIGWTAHSSTDFGVNPFDEHYANVGTHASVLNTILQGKFLTEAPYWFSSLLSVLLAIGLIYLIRRLSTGMKIAVGFGATIAFFFLAFLIFAVTGVYIAILSPLLAVFISFLTFSLAVFFLSEQEKKFLSEAFATYLPPAVISQLVDNPEYLKLGGTKMWLSAMFTDVRGFSTISEQLTPEDLVKLLNLYLTGMSDIILENQGTIDKYEGDAIISFFGAPIPFETHAQAICRSAIAMKKKELELNEIFIRDKLTPHRLLTRIGLNTGDMVVGNMGTEKKKDYTIMGNAVNLAARLEGVNKQYGSWILASETTRMEAGDEFAWRRLDRVRVVGINQPVRLYELIDHVSALTSAQSNLLGLFDEALTVFETRDWKSAAKQFGTIVKLYPDDGPAKKYLERSLNFAKTPPGADFEGVNNLTEK